MKLTTIAALVLASLMWIGIAPAQTLLTPGETVRGKWERSDPAYPGTVDHLMPNGVQYKCYALDTTPGSHWELTVGANGAPYLAIGRGATCPEARAAKEWFHRASGTGLWNPKATLRVTASGGRYVVSVTSGYYGGYKIAAVETAGGDGYVTLPPGRRPRHDPPAGTASTVGALAASNHVPGQAFRDCETCPEMVVLPAGGFMMGSSDLEEGRDSSEGPRHNVTIGRPFAMGRFEVTFDEYDACVTDGGCDAVTSDSGWGRGRRPVINVAYPNAKRYVAWLSETTGHNYFLPSEAEWEYAARAGTTTPWSTGTAIITADANFLKTFGKTVPTGSYPPNAFGLHDMHGNIWEWTQDCMDAGYLGAPQDGSAASSGDCANKRIVRGGAYDSSHGHVRSADRGIVAENSKNSSLGFRVARAL